MATEFEAKFLNINIDETRAKLANVGAKCEQPMRIMRREMFDFPDGSIQGVDKSGRLRIRDEGDKVTLTYKKTVLESDYDHEVELTVDSYDAAKQLLGTLGLLTYSYQESKREAWALEDVEIVLDEWPWLKPYFEIEGSNETSIKEVARKLGYDWQDAKFGSVDTAYKEQYPKMGENESIGDIAQVRFDLAIPGYLQERM